jgi:site-specific DNA recombinase
VSKTLKPFKKLQKSRTKLSPDFPLRNFALCGEGNTPLTASWSTGNGGRFGYYRCYNSECGSVKVRKEKIETAFIQVLAELSVSSAQYSLLEAVVRVVREQRFSALTDDEMRIKSKVEALESKRASLLEALTEGVVETSLYQSRENELKAEISDLQLELNSLPRLGFDLDDVLSHAKELLADLPGYWNQLDPQFRPQFVGAFLPTGVVYANGIVRTTQTP